MFEMYQETINVDVNDVEFVGKFNGILVYYCQYSEGFPDNSLAIILPVAGGREIYSVLTEEQNHIMRMILDRGLTTPLLFLDGNTLSYNCRFSIQFGNFVYANTDIAEQLRSEYHSMMPTGRPTRRARRSARKVPSDAGVFPPEILPDEVVEQFEAMSIEEPAVSEWREKHPRRCVKPSIVEE